MMMFRLNQTNYKQEAATRAQHERIRFKSGVENLPKIDEARMERSFGISIKSSPPFIHNASLMGAKCSFISYSNAFAYEETT